jgi:hypothetical protein
LYVCTVDKSPTITWDGTFGLLTTGIGIVTSDGLYIGSNSKNYGMMWNCQIPQDKNALTFSVWMNPTWGNSGMYNSIGFYTSNNQARTGLIFGTHPAAYNTTSVSSTNVNRFDFTPDWGRPPANMWTFITWTFIFENGNLTLKVYWNGVKKAETIIPNDSLIRSPNERVVLGSPFGNDNPTGTFKHYSIHKELTDDQVLELYLNGGIPNM